MTLKEFLQLIEDEDTRVEICIDEENAKDYLYKSFWLDDYRKGLKEITEYNDYTVRSLSFMPEDYIAEISINIKNY